MTNVPVLAHAKWLPASWQHDSQQTIQTLGAERVDRLVAVHFGLDKRWDESLRPHARKIMVIDDLAYRGHDCDLLLDHNLASYFETCYQHLLPEHCVTLFQQFYQCMGYQSGDFPEAEVCDDRAISLPLYAGLTDSDQDYVTQKIKGCVL